MNKKQIIIIASVVVTVGISVLLFFLLKKDSNYPEEPITQKVLSTSFKEGIDTTSLPLVPGDDYELYTVSQKVKLEYLETMASDLGLTLTDSEEGLFYQWDKGSSQIFYDLTKNVVLMTLKDGIPSDEAEITGYSFKLFVKKYFKEDWDYDVFKSEKRSTGETVYYANRLIDKIPIEMRENNQETDYIATKDGKILYAQILLTIFDKENIQVPIISTSELVNYIDSKYYPKEIYPSYSTLQSTILKQVNYLSEDFEEIANTIGNCKSTSSKVIYLYKSFNQELLTPVYKLESECTVTYEEEEYSVPAVMYVNAIDPDYISIPE